MDYLDLLNNPVYRHALLNHIPIIGLCIALLVLLAGLAVRRAPVLFTGLVLAAVCAGASVVVVHYGDAAYPVVYDSLDRQGRGWLDFHAHLADRWLPLLCANAVLAVFAVVLGSARRRLLLWVALLVTLLTLASIRGIFEIARAGGQIRHPEFRISDPPATELRRER